VAGAAGLSEGSRLDEWRQRFAPLPGWFNDESVHVWDCLLAFQAQRGLRGHFFEIGVFHGKSAGLAWLHTRGGEEILLVDPYRLETVLPILEAVRSQGIKAFPLTSDRLPVAALDPYRGGCRWLHVDGEHTGFAAAHDLALADSLLHDQGVVVVDDFMTANYPQVTASVFAYLHAHPKHLSLFLCGFHKGYLARPRAARTYLEYVRDRLQDDLAARGFAERITLWKTTSPEDINCFGMRSWDGRRQVGLDWDKAKILI
jgi:hypothetical protein